MRTQQGPIISWLYLLGISLLFQGIPSPTQSAQPVAAPSAAVTLQHSDQPRLVVQLGHSSQINSVAFSPDGRHVLTGSADNTARLWDRETGREVRRFGGHAPFILSVAFSPDGRYVLTGSNDKTARLWDRETGKEVRRFEGHEGLIYSVAFSRDGRYVLTGSGDKTARLWDPETAREVRRFEGYAIFISSVAFSPDGRCILTGGWDKTARLWDLETGKEVRRFKGHTEGISSVGFSPEGRYVLTGGWDGTARLWDLETGKEVRRFKGHEISVESLAVSPAGKRRPKGEIAVVVYVAFSPDGRYVLTGSNDKTARLWDRETGKEVRRFEGHTEGILSVAYCPDGRYVLTGSGDNTARLWDRETGKEVRRIEGHADSISSVAFSPGGDYVLTGSDDGPTRLWDVSTRREFASLISFVDDSWVVVAPDGRFDTNNLEEIKGLHWIMPDNVLRPLPLEIFMRDYYEPRLLPRVLAGEKLPAIRSLAELNRVQPKVEIARVDLDHANAGTVTVTVEVSAASGSFTRDGKTVTRATDVYDLRLFRDGQLVAQMPILAYEPSTTGTSWEEGLRQWRRSHEISLDPKTRRKTLTFRGIRLPRRTGLKDMEFSAYAFNEDRVKSSTARTRLAIPKDLPPRQGNAYVITVGVNAYENSDWDLHYAAKDAQYFSDIVKPLLEKSKNYTAVVLVRLISDWTREQNDQRKVVSSDATKARFKAVLDFLAGRDVNPAIKSTIPNIERLRPALPEDLVLIAFSSHGYADQSGTFYLFPYDIGSHVGEKVTSELLQRTISSDELSNWMREIDAGELVMIIDACHSAASVEGTGFKPGPMGARGLGQLAYDKGMRILASTRADDVAWESPLTKQGLLSYALVQNGLVMKQADFDPKDKKILLSEWLKYGVKRVPELYEEVRSGQAKSAEEKAAKLTSYRRGVVRVEDVAGTKTQAGGQQPSLFDFRRAVPYEPLITRLGE